jgi:hypothetical protein
VRDADEGADSTHALLVAVDALRRVGTPRAGVLDKDALVRARLPAALGAPVFERDPELEEFSDRVVSMVVDLEGAVRR